MPETGIAPSFADSPLFSQAGGLEFLLVRVVFRIATQIVPVNGTSALKAFPLLYPVLILPIPSSSHVRASRFMARYAIDRKHRALVATNFVQSDSWHCVLSASIQSQRDC